MGLVKKAARVFPDKGSILGAGYIVESALKACETNGRIPRSALCKDGAKGEATRQFIKKRIADLDEDLAKEFKRIAEENVSSDIYKATIEYRNSIAPKYF
jgi:hypothetical protein